MKGASSSSSYEEGALLNKGRYRIVKELNRGGTAIVYKALDTGNNRYVALKVMNCPDIVPVEVVKREIAVSTITIHDNIVRLLDVFAEGKHQLVIVWELISGPDLLELLNEHGGCMSEEMAAYYFVQLLRAVLFMHDKGYCHRDIKSENCMVERHTNRLKLIDFGLSKHLESAQTLGVGTPDYMCPEMLSHSALPIMSRNTNGTTPGANQPYEPRMVDAWAMGVVLYLLVSGKYPFEDPRHPNNIAQTINNVLNGHMRPLPETVSQECVSLIKSLLKVQPASRLCLEELPRNKWLRQKAKDYARKIHRPELVNFEEGAHKILSLNKEGVDLKDSDGGLETDAQKNDSKLVSGFKKMFQKKNTTTKSVSTWCS